MLKTACVFDRTIIGDFYKNVEVENEFNNVTMYFAMYEDDAIIGMVKMYPQNSKCRIEKVVGNSILTEEKTEFLLKSAINYALTFQTSHLVCDIIYKKYLVPMHFVEVSGELIGDINKVDFPSKCSGE